MTIDRGPGSNVTFDPLATALAVDDPAISELLDFDTGEFLDARAWIGGQRYEELIAERVNVRERLAKNPRFRCSLCSVLSYLVSNQHKRFFFRHMTEDGSCPAETRSPLSREEILARKYDGIGESEPHKRIKRMIVRSLEADPSYSGILAERQWRSSQDPRSRRQPDVQATGPSGRIAFEVQLSTTFLDVVAGRRSFYREEGALLAWVMGGFDPEYRRLTTDDLLFSNNSNILVVDDETASISELQRKFHVRCHFRRPVRDGDQLVDRWEASVVPFGSLACELDMQRCWHFDYEGQAAAIRAAIEQELHKREAAATDKVRNDLFSFWVTRLPHTQLDEEGVRAWASLRQAFFAREIALPALPDDSSSFVALMNGLASAREGRPVGWSFQHLVQVAHRIADGYPEHVAAFGHAIRHFARQKTIETQDHTGKWKRRAEGIGRSLRAGEPDFAPEPNSIDLAGFLIPGLKEKLAALVLKIAL
ncbi:hypothetical protein AS026_05310 [Rhizobium altiplani]|uniref:Competence protein n=1 Tax=Rhizobium altiplani TaxID=1864509 RepID=A0A109JNM1_9HYPH|nr:MULTISPECIES: DUF6035 family protein [Rhizobium]KWV51989.1 hypothetical protein AS026_05310 [Rhizobium altiplani]